MLEATVFILNLDDANLIINNVAPNMYAQPI